MVDGAAAMVAIPRIDPLSEAASEIDATTLVDEPAVLLGVNVVEATPVELVTPEVGDRLAPVEELHAVAPVHAQLIGTPGCPEPRVTDIVRAALPATKTVLLGEGAAPPIFIVSEPGAAML
jgi:hypothetical protein